MKRRLIKISIFLIITIISSIYTIKWLTTFDLDLDNETLEILLESSGNIKSENRVISKLVTVIKDTDLINPLSIIINDYDSPKEEVIEEVINEIPVKKEPIVYIYNTHQKEKYYTPQELNISYTVMDASFFLQKELKKYDIESIVETLSVSDVLNTNNWNYATSYKVSRMFMEKAKEKNKELKYFIDLHRDSVNKSISTVEINGKKYARTMFLLGLDNKSYSTNEKEMNILEKYLNTNYPGLSRGIYKKQGKGVNGVYNQDFSKYCVLIEVGGEENTFEEVENTISVIAEMFNYYIGENSD